MPDEHVSDSPGNGARAPVALAARDSPPV